MESTVEFAPPSLHELRKRREAILEPARLHGARDVRVFGSVARGDETGTEKAATAPTEGGGWAEHVLYNAGGRGLIA
jgi:hypothetical protein